MVESHLKYVATHSEALSFEVYAYWARNAETRKAAHEWFAWLAAHDAELIHTVGPTLAPAECADRALQVITLCLGAWVTLSQSRPVLA